MKRIILLSIIGIIVWGIVFIPLLGMWITPHKDVLSIGSLEIRDRHGNLMTNKGRSDGYHVPYRDSLHTRLIDAIIHIEDQRFWRHGGVDIYAKIASLLHNLQTSDTRRGGSTITEQWIKNRFFPYSARTMWQKLHEALIARGIEYTHSKDDILRGYLDSLYFWDRIYGIGTYLQIYYPEYYDTDLPERDIIHIIAKIRTPNWDTADERFFEYEKQIQMRLGWTGSLEPYVHTPRTPHFIDTFPLLTSRIDTEISAYCQDKPHMLDRFVLHIPKDLCTSSHISLTTTIDAPLMHEANTIIWGVLHRLREHEVTNSAVLIMDPKTKTYMVYLGSWQSSSPEASEIDMITRRRSVWSLLKPFIYQIAIREGGADTEDMVLDTFRAYPTGQWTNFIPFNYIPTEYWPISLREALGNSLNSATVRITETLNLDRVYHALRSMGLDLEHDIGYYGYGLSIGTAELTLENVVQTTTALLDMSHASNFLIMQALRDPDNRSRAFGVTSILNTSIPLPVKTGTSTDFRDNWTLSYHPNAIIGVWVGNNTSKPMRDVSGITGAAPIWKHLAEALITRGMITSWDPPKPPDVSLTSRCLDRSCLRIKQVYSQHSWPLPFAPTSLQSFYGVITPQEQLQWNLQP